MKEQILEQIQSPNFTKIQIDIDQYIQTNNNKLSTLKKKKVIFKYLTPLNEEL